MKELDKTIAVLPFVNMSDSDDNEHFCDGITEEIINSLAKIKQLKVTSRTSSFFFKNKDIPITEIGEQLYVSSILEGSVRLHGDMIRITAQLINVAEDYHFWSETWDRELQNIFAIQDEISLLIAEKLRENIGHFEIDKPTATLKQDINAYELYLKSKSNFNVFQKNDILLAAEQIQAVIDLDPSCPFYHASKSKYYSYLCVLNAIPMKEGCAISKKAAEIAISLDPTDPEANYSIGVVSYYFEKDLSKAQIYIDLALKYRPNYTDALLGGSIIDAVTNNPKRSIERVKKAREIDPLTPTNIYYHAAALLRSERYAEALIEVNAILALIPHHTNSYILKGVILTRLQKYDEAVAHYKLVPITTDKTEIYYSGIGTAYATQGNLDKAKEYLNKVYLDEQKINVAAEENASVIINIYLGNLDLAFELIEKDIQANEYYLNFYKENPAFKLLADDPRYKIFDKIFITNGTSQSIAEEKPLSGKKKPLLDDATSKQYSENTLQIIEKECPYLESSLSLRELAELTNIHPNHLSWLLNDHFGKSFSDFINFYRLEAFKKKAVDSKNAHITLLGLAYESGFNSKTAFNNYFKKETGLTPTVWIKSVT